MLLGNGLGRVGVDEEASGEPIVEACGIGCNDPRREEGAVAAVEFAILCDPTLPLALPLPLPGLLRVLSALVRLLLSPASETSGGSLAISAALISSGLEVRRSGAAVTTSRNGVGSDVFFSPCFRAASGVSSEA